MKLLTRRHSTAGYQIGIYADGDPLIIPPGLHLLAGGLSGSGKSSLIRAVLARVAPTSARIVFVDRKRVESEAWRTRATVAVTSEEIGQLLAGLLVEVDARYELLAAHRLVEWVDELGQRIVLVIDELAGVVAFGDKYLEARNISALRQLLERARAAGVQIIAATQRPDATTIPTAIRDLFQVRVGFATATEAGTEMILGAAWEIGPCHQLPVGDGHGGLCFCLVDGERTPRLARIGWLTPDQARTIAHTTAHHHRPAPGPVAPPSPHPTPPEPLQRPVDTIPPTAAPIANASVQPDLGHTTATNTAPSPLPPPTIPLPGIVSPLPAPPPSTTAPSPPAPAEGKPSLVDGAPAPTAPPTLTPAPWPSPASLARQAVAVAGRPDGSCGLDGDDLAVYETLRAAGRALSARHTYDAIRPVQPFSVRRAEHALTRLVAAGHARQIGTTYTPTAQ